MSNNMHFAVAVGINEYPELKSLHSASGDAHNFAAWLRSPTGGDLPQENVAVITLPAEIEPPTDRNTAKPDRDAVLQNVYRFMKMAEEHVKNNPGDWKKTRFYFYASGHGIAPESSEAALLMANAGPDWYGENLPCSSLLDYLAFRQPFKEIVLFADCCREYLPEAPLGGIPWSRIRRDNGHILNCRGFATYFGDYAYEPEPDLPPDDRRGYFTAALLEGLKGKAVNPEKGVVDSNSLAAYVSKKVTETTAHMPAPQAPQIFTEPGNPIIFRQVVNVSEVSVTIHFNHSSGQAKLIDGQLKPAGQWSIEDGDWELPLKNGMYRLVVEADGETQVKYFDVMGENTNVTI